MWLNDWVGSNQNIQEYINSQLWISKEPLLATQETSLLVEMLMSNICFNCTGGDEKSLPLHQVVCVSNPNFMWLVRSPDTLWCNHFTS